MEPLGRLTGLGPNSVGAAVDSTGGMPWLRAANLSVHRRSGVRLASDFWGYLRQGNRRASLGAINTGSFATYCQLLTSAKKKNRESADSQR